MKAARLTSPRRFEFVEVETPKPLEGEVLIRTERLSICGSDLRHYDRVLPEEEYPLELGRPCHECIGVVEESRARELAEGQRVIVLPTTRGGLMERLVEKPSRIIPVPEGGDPAVWLMCQPMGTVLHACQRTGSVLGKRVAILGQGAIGLSFTTLMAMQGASQIIVTDMLDYRLALAKRLGATHTINARREDVPRAVAELTGGAMADIVIEAAGEEATLNQSFYVVKRYGHVTLFGIQWEEKLTLDFARMFDQQITVLNVSSARSDDPTGAIKQCVELVAQRRMDLSHLITHRMAFGDVQQAYDTYSRKLDNVIKVVMRV
jgi:L-iditol 2-dehydrogenase